MSLSSTSAVRIDPADAAPDYWRHVHNRLSVERDASRLQPHASPGLVASTRNRLMTRLAMMLATMLSSGTLGTSAFVDLPKTADLERQRQRTDRPLFPAGG